MKTLSTGDIVEISGIPANTLDRWCNDFGICPDSGGEGKGDHRRWSVVQAVIFRLAGKLRESGFNGKFVLERVESLQGLTLDEMTAAFDEGRTHFMKLPDGPLVKSLDPESLDRDMPFTNFKTCYDETLKAIAKIERRSKRNRNKTGRNRGLAEAASR